MDKTALSEIAAIVKHLEAQCAAMRAAIVKLSEWSEGECGDYWCLWCGSEKSNGHNHLCPRQSALSGEAGKDLLQRYNELMEWGRALVYEFKMESFANKPPAFLLEDDDVHSRSN